MEQVLSFVSANQSTRNKAFMFFWRVLMAILLTDIKMNNLGLATNLPDKEIHFPDIVRFVFGDDFIFSATLYLMFIFLFFWAFKILRLVAFDHLLESKQWTKEEIIERLKFWRLVRVRENQVLIKKKKSLIIIRLVMRDKVKEGDNGSSILNSVITTWNVVFSTCYFIHSSDSFCKNFTLIPAICYSAFFMLTLLLWHLLRFYFKTNRLSTVVRELEPRGFFMSEIV
jgi:hypothetical protein